MRRRDFLKLLAPVAAGAAVGGPAIAAAVRGLYGGAPVPVARKSSRATFSVNGRTTIGGALVGRDVEAGRYGEFVEFGTVDAGSFRGALRARRGEPISVHEFDVPRALRDGDVVEADLYVGLDGDPT